MGQNLAIIFFCQLATYQLCIHLLANSHNFLDKCNGLMNDKLKLRNIGGRGEIYIARCHIMKLHCQMVTWGANSMKMELFDVIHEGSGVKYGVKQRLRTQSCPPVHAVSVSLLMNPYASKCMI